MATLLSVAVTRILEPIEECHCDDLSYDWEDYCSCERTVEADKDHAANCEVWYEDFEDSCVECIQRSELMERVDKFFYDPHNQHFREEVMTQLQVMDIPNLVVIQIVDVLNQVVAARHG